MSLKALQAETGGALTGGNAEFSSVSIDTRTLAANDLFVAIKGPNFNGNDFVSRAAEAQACGAIVTEPVDCELPVLQVDDSRQVLGRIGALNRAQSTACVIGLTGSQGKTSVKEMTASILACSGEVTMTRGNLNNDLGVPLSLLEIGSQHQYAVIEMGANGPGEIAYMVELVKPAIAHVTVIAGTHLEGFGDIEGVARAKGEIWQGVCEGGMAVVNLDDEYAGQFIDQVNTMEGNRQVITVSGRGQSRADYFAGKVSFDKLQGARFALHTPDGIGEITLQVTGQHNINNAVAAAAMAMSAGASLEHVRQGLAKFAPVKGRMNVVAGCNGATIIDDTYNASPSSFKAAIDVLALNSGRTIVVMGDMGELGNTAEQLHRDVGIYAREQGVHELFAVGKLSRLAVEAFGKGGQFLEDRDMFAAAIRPLLDASTTVLVKGSRSQGMEQLVQQIKAGGA